MPPGVRCPTGDARHTPAFGLPCGGGIVHAVGPWFDAARPQECQELLASAYRRSLDVGARHGHTHLAFPAISCGVFGYPLLEGAQVALGAVEAYFKQARSEAGWQEDAQGLGESGGGTGSRTGRGRSSGSSDEGVRTVSFVLFEAATVAAWLGAAQARGMELVQAASPAAVAGTASTEAASAAAAPEASSSSSSSSSSGYGGGGTGKFLWQVAALIVAFLLGRGSRDGCYFYHRLKR